MRFAVYGPVQIPVDDRGRIVEQRRLTTEFWSDRIEIIAPGLSDGKGCYIFSIATRGSARLMPWYVGKTNAQTFREECFKNHQRNHYAYALGEYEVAVPYLFLVPLITNTGRISGASTGQAESVIKELEYFFIARGIERNHDLRNTSDTAFFRDTIVPGFLNNEGRPPLAAQELQQTFD